MTIKTDWLPGDVFTSGDLNDLTVEVQSKLDASDAGGVDTDMLADDAVTSAKVSAAIRTSLGKADSAVQPADLSSAIAGLSGVAVNAQTANYTLVLADASKAVEVTSASSTTVTVPPNSSVAFPVGTIIEVVRLGTGSVTLLAGSGVTLNTASSLICRVQYSVLTLRKRASDTWLVAEDML